ncbi:MAG: hypothetical protein O3B41_03230 [Bacteroidetes bacterium]|nr:hypothetical protein [Bacteroidota bacterium]
MKNESDPESKQVVEYDSLNAAGKAVFIAGTAYKVAERIIDFTFSTLQSVWDEAEKAFQLGLNEGVSKPPVPSKPPAPPVLTDLKDAVILDETKD